MHVSVVILHVEVLSLVEKLPHSRLGEIFDKGVVFWKSLMRSEKKFSALFGISVSNKLLRFSQELGNKSPLGIIDTFYEWLVFGKLLVITTRNRT